MWTLRSITGGHQNGNFFVSNSSGKGDVNLSFKLCCVVILTILTTSGCKTTNYAQVIVPQYRFYYPETVGKHEFSIGLSTQSDDFRVVFSEDDDIYPIDTENPEIKVLGGSEERNTGGPSPPPLDLGYGISDPLEIGFLARPTNTLYLRYMLVGKPQTQAIKNAQSVSVTIRTRNELDDTASAIEIDGSSHEVAISYGYRIAKEFLGYIGIFRSEIYYDITFNSLSALESSIGPSNATIIENGFSIGFLSNPFTRFQLGAEINYVDITAGESFMGAHFQAIRLSYTF